MHSLISGNLMDVCPVGAITTKDYRFKSRPWDNPRAVDTICTFCSKGCNTTAWLRAKPEWAKGATLVRMTPRLNHAVNGYWMCDIGRFEYHWVEGDDRLRTCFVRGAGAAHEPTIARDAVATAAGRLVAAGGRVRFLVSAHASHEELFLIRSLAAAMGGQDITVSWRYREKPQPADTQFPVPPIDAPNLAGARDLGFRVAAEPGPADVGPLREAVEGGSVGLLYVFDPGPDGSLGDVSWIVAARQAGRLPQLIVQGVLMTDLARAADIVLAGASSFEKDASYTNDKGIVQAAARALAPPGDAVDDWQIFANLLTAVGSTTLVHDLRAGAGGRRRVARRKWRIRGADAARVFPSGHGDHVASGLQPVGTLEMGFAVSGSAARQVRRDACVGLAAGRHPASTGRMSHERVKTR